MSNTAITSETLVIWQEDQQITYEDLGNIGLYARNSLDHVVADMLEPGAKFTGFNAVVSGPAQVTVGAGRLIANGGKVYGRYDEGGVTLDLITKLPALARKIVTIIAFGQEVPTDLEPVTFLKDIDTEATESRTVSTELRRIANIDIVVGLESSDPKPPALDANYLAIAHVLLDPSGIVTPNGITRVTDNVAGSVRENAIAIADLKGWRARAGSRLDTFDTSLAGINDALRGLAKSSLVLSLARDVSRLAVRANLPETYTAYGAEDFFDTSHSDTAHPDYNALVRGGLFFPPDTRTVGQLALANPIDPSVTVQNNFILPKWTEVERPPVAPPSGEIALSQFQYQSVQAVQKTRSRTVVEQGPRITPRQFFSIVEASGQRASLALANQTVRIGDTSYTWSVTVNSAYELIDTPAVSNWREVTYQEPYWENVTIPVTVNGSVVAQSFLNTEDGYLTGIGLPFPKVGGSGDVRVLVVETVDARPDYKKVIAQTTVAAADLKALPARTKALFAPTLLLKGRRYGYFVISSGAHFLATTSGEKDANGSLFYGLDAEVVQADATRDIPHSLFFARFAAPRIEVQLAPLTLAAGIVNITINADKFIPAGTSLSFERVINGKRYPIRPGVETPINVNPTLIQLYAVLVGTTDLMPGFGIGPLSETIVDYPKTALTHVSTAWTLPAPCNTIELHVRVPAFDETKHNLVAKVLRGGGYTTVETADTVDDEATPDPGVVLRRFVFNLGAATSSFKIRLEGQISSIQEQFAVAETYWLAFS